MSDVRLIDANALHNVFDAMHAIPGGSHLDHLVLLGIKNFINDAPTIDAVPVVHGRWDEVGKVLVHSMYDLFTKCSQCSFGHVRNEYQEPYHYCPNCGAKMDGGAE